MTAFDIFVILMLGSGAVIGFVRGFVQEVLSLMAWVGAVLAVKLFHGIVAARLIEPVGTEAGAAAAALAAIFLPVFFVVRWLAGALGRRTRRSLIGPIDRVLGSLFGLLKGLLAATLAFLVANLAVDFTYGSAADRPEWMTRSISYPLMNASARSIINYVEQRRAREEAAT